MTVVNRVILRIGVFSTTLVAVRFLMLPEMTVVNRVIIRVVFSTLLVTVGSLLFPEMTTTCWQQSAGKLRTLVHSQ